MFEGAWPLINTGQIVFGFTKKSRERIAKELLPVILRVHANMRAANFFNFSPGTPEDLRYAFGAMIFVTVICSEFIRVRDTDKKRAVLAAACLTELHLAIVAKATHQEEFPISMMVVWDAELLELRRPLPGTQWGGADFSSGSVPIDVLLRFHPLAACMART